MNKKHLDIDFPSELSNFFSSSIEFSTSVATIKNKQEVRNGNWLKPRNKYTLQYKYCTQQTFEKLKTFFLICKGREKTFNFLDATDNKLCNQVLAIANENQTEFKIIKTYNYNGFTAYRDIFRLKNVHVFVNNTEVGAENFVIQDNILKFMNYEIKQNDIISIDATFYVICRFDSDCMSASSRQFNSVELPEITLLETNIQ